MFNIFHNAATYFAEADADSMAIYQRAIVLRLPMVVDASTAMISFHIRYATDDAFVSIIFAMGNRRPSCLCLIVAYILGR